MATKTLDERIAEAHQQSVRLYLQRQGIEAQRQQLAQAAAQCDQTLLRLDGEIDALTRMKDEASRGE